MEFTFTKVSEIFRTIVFRKIAEWLPLKFEAVQRSILFLYNNSVGQPQYAFDFSNFSLILF